MKCGRGLTETWYTFWNGGEEVEAVPECCIAVKVGRSWQTKDKGSGCKLVTFLTVATEFCLVELKAKKAWNEAGRER